MELLSQDILRSLLERQMHHIIDSILVYLDESSLRNCLQVSTTWNLITKNEKIWKKLYQKLSKEEPILEALSQRRLNMSVHTDSPIAEEISFLKLFEDKLKVDTNWMNGHFTSKILDLGNFSISMLRIDAKRIVGCAWRFPGPHSIIVWNRWTLKKECILEEPSRIVGHSFMADIQIVEDLIVCSYHKGNICIWDLNSRQIVKHFKSNLKSQYVRLHATKKLLIGCYTFRGQNEFQYLTLFIMCEIASIASRICINRSELMYDATVSSIHTNSVYFVLFIKTLSGLKIQLRTLDAFHVIREVNMPCDPLDVFFASGFGGLVFASNETKTIKCYDPDSFFCTRICTMTHMISSFFIYSHFLIIQTTEERILVFDMHLNCNEILLDIENCTWPSEKFKMQIHNSISFCDGLQLVAISKKCGGSNSFSSYLTVVNFLGDNE